jgi:hypothetical protein
MVQEKVSGNRKNGVHGARPCIVKTILKKCYRGIPPSLDMFSKILPSRYLPDGESKAGYRLQSQDLSGCRRWIWLPVWRTGLKPKTDRILIISGADSRGIFDKIIHFNVKVGQLVIPGCQLNQKLVMLLKTFLEILHSLLF